MASTQGTNLERIADRAARATPDKVARRIRGLSDRAIAWLFIAPTIVLLLAIIGLFARKVTSLGWTLLFGTFVGAVLAFAVAHMGGKYYLEIILPGSLLAREAHDINPGAGRVRLALVAETEECLAAAQRIASFVRSTE